MEVTRENFQKVLQTLPDVLENAEFIAFDTEFTGLRVEGASNLNYFDTLEDLYLKDRLKAGTFMAIQIGLVAFSYDKEANRFSHTAYNFFVYPSSHSNVNFTCQSNCVKFLIQHGFDFNKLFREGIPYLRETEKDKLLEKLTEKYEKKQDTGAGAQIEIPNEHKEIINKTIAKIKDISDSNGKCSFATDRYNSFIRRLIFNSVQKEFGSSVLVESNSDESMRISVGFSASEVQEMQKEKFLLQKKEILDEIGFSNVIKLLLDSKKLLVGHNLFLDILFVIKQFVVSLPESYSEFKELVSFLFPKIIDTKYMAASAVRQIKDTSLQTLVEHFENLKAFPEVAVHENGAGYTLQDKKLHEAAYDAYLTGMCFLAMAEFCGKVSFKGNNVFDNLESSFFLQSHLNKLSIPKLCDITCMNLGGVDSKPDRSGVYHLVFPEEWTREDIVELFKNCGFIYISWINSTSAFVKVKKEYIAEVERSLMVQNQRFRLMTHSQFRSLNSSELIWSPKGEKQIESEVKSSAGGNSSVSVSVNASGRKRKVEEDIGVVLDRFQQGKKHAPADS